AEKQVSSLTLGAEKQVTKSFSDANKQGCNYLVPRVVKLEVWDELWSRFRSVLGLKAFLKLLLLRINTEEASVAPGGGDEDKEMPQAVPPPRTQGERIARLEEEVHGMREALQGQRVVLDSMAHDFSRFTTWTVTSLAQLMDRAGVPYTIYSELPVEYQRCTKQRTDGASTSTAPQQPDP
ncbi:hypothetical protein Tco_1276539, partial [Tanacetum coccineum]